MELLIHLMFVLLLICHELANLGRILILVGIVTIQMIVTLEIDCRTLCSLSFLIFTAGQTSAYFFAHK